MASPPSAECGARDVGGQMRPSARTPHALAFGSSPTRDPFHPMVLPPGTCGHAGLWRGHVGRARRTSRAKTAPVTG